MQHDVTRLRCHSQRANIFHFVAYIMKYLEVIVYQIPPGGKRGLKPAQGLENYILYFSVIWGVPCSSSDNSKSI